MTLYSTGTHSNVLYSEQSTAAMTKATATIILEYIKNRHTGNDPKRGEERTKKKNVENKRETTTKPTNTTQSLFFV